MVELAELLSSEPEFQSVLKQVTVDSPDGLVTGLSGGARHLYYAALYLYQQTHRPNTSLLIVTHSAGEAEIIADDLREFLPDTPILLYPERELLIAGVIAFSRDVMAERLQVLQHLASGTPAVVVTTVAGALQPVMKRDFCRDSIFTWRVGKEVPSDYAQKFVSAGYERVEMVDSQGQFSIRGGIVDIFPLTEPRPIRVELFDTEVDSIRTFDVGTQRSLDSRTEVTIGPALDFLVPASQLETVADELEHHLEQRVRTLTDVDVRERLQGTVGEDVRRMREGLPFYGQLRYTQVLQRHIQTLLEYFPGLNTLILDEPARIQEREKGLEKEFQEWLTAALMRGDILSGTVLGLSFDKLWAHPRFACFQFSTFARPTGTHRYVAMAGVTAKPMQNFHGQMNLLKAEAERWLKSGMRVLMLAATPERADRLERVLEDYRIRALRSQSLTDTTTPQVLVGNLSSGFELPMSRIVLIVETEVFGTRKKGRRLRAEMSDAERIKSYQELRVGDFVVHVNHGIGKYLGIRTLEIDGRHKDYLHLQYAGNDTLYVPVEQIDQVQRFIGSEERAPKVNHLGGGEWTRVKQRVSKSVQDIADDLVKLYAARQATPGHPFPLDTPWQKDFEAMFPYEETPDQLRAIDEIKRDMELPRPMDRLLCGDVGYGKTEVAIRAAFKAVMDGKQVAVLVPTTVLAHQHFETFKERFAGYPATVEVLSRFRTRGEAQTVVKGLEDGSIDVVIGTHRLLQKSLKFKDLGLLIVDEEQRFGVTHKERLKQMRTNVDCLTLTATPIPRTLHMSMLGVRDLSVIETPPENRFPVQTYVVEFNENLLHEAIERELNRGGQVYVLYNHVSGIRSMADRVRRMVPNANVGVAHGQMAEDELERVMLDFLDGELDVLVTTTIIETGLDIPNVNTLIVYDADRLGLAQLYQLRGRVGRSNRIAYAYFTYQRDKVLTEIAEKRLQAIKEFTELGSGFKIAMRDLAIRGAGNLLGAEQHGFINSVGFDLYNDMLTAAVKEAKGEVEEVPPEPTIDLAIEAYLPDDFIPNPAQKIAVYKKFKFVRSQDGANDLEEELEDRYGDLPDAVRNLLDVTRIKSYAARYGIEAVAQQGHESSIRIPPERSNDVDHAALFALAKRMKGQYVKRSNGVLQVTFRTRDLAERQLCALLLQFFGSFHEALRSPEQVTEVAK
ncbi:transcription-repair coupling factor [Alicyclobacillus sp. ALC3]|uniref:transcription-repair coupling factor n=1 Tax=Alicyclobacillus sp. ALC3 TaxID=2796143 RepID=UPI002377F729|nr:transcription-repair coupling factor [Alicyclobacillus sp. ALC3]WDL98991.1 transcription-repair coupling factor [Alicyclobacillus sp. ALC3]